MAAERDDGVNEGGLDYRAGYCEGLAAFLTAMQVMAVRAKPKEAAGLELAFAKAKEIREAMLAKMRGK